jgi:hypothetical protein
MRKSDQRMSNDQLLAVGRAAIITDRMAGAVVGARRSDGAEFRCRRSM